jgi:2-phosphosulfolactate phosphatase
VETPPPAAGIVHDDQSPYDARFDWGAAGLRAVAAAAKVVVVVDVLSFGTAVAVAVGRGAAVLPCGWNDDRAESLARASGALLAVHRPNVGPDRPYSLSPATLRALPAGARLVLPSPNGSRLSALASEATEDVLAGCLRNAGAVARAARDLATGGAIAVIAAGERRRDPDEPLRPAVEDLVGAGAILDALGAARPSPEARAAIAGFRAAANDLPAFLAGCASGRELIAAGFPDDVAIAAEFDVDLLPPILRAGAFVPHG